MGKRKLSNVLVVSDFRIGKKGSSDQKLASTLEEWAKDFSQIVLLGNTFDIWNVWYPSDTQARQNLTQIRNDYPRTFDTLQRHNNILVISGIQDIGLSHLLFRTSDISILPNTHIQYSHKRIYTKQQKYKWIVWLKLNKIIPNVIANWWIQWKQLKAITKMARMNSIIKTFVFAEGTKRYVREVLIDGNLVTVVNVGSHLNNPQDVTVIDLENNTVIQNKVYHKPSLKSIISQLQPGDIILTLYKPHPISNMIAQLTNGDWSHVAIYAGNGLIYESTGKGGVHRSPISVAFDGLHNVLIRRPYNQEAVPKILKAIRKRIGLGYGFTQIALSFCIVMLNKLFKWTGVDFRKILHKDYFNSQVVCSELIAYGFKEGADQEIAPSIPPNNTEPQHFATTKLCYTKGILIEQ